MIGSAQATLVDAVPGKLKNQVRVSPFSGD